MSELTVQTMSERDARRLTERIRIAAVNYSDAKDKLFSLVDEAKQGNAHVALKYDSWTGYLQDVLTGEPLRLARTERPAVVGYLAEQEMPNTVIAKMLGVDEKTVRNDLRSEYSEREPRQVIRTDGQVLTVQPRIEQEKEVVTVTMERPKLSGPRKKDLNILANVNLGLTGYVAALDQMIRTGLDDSVTAEEADALHADLSRSIKELTTIARMLKTRKDS